MLPLQLKLLGGFEARLGTGNPVILPRRKAQALLAYLALSPGQIYLRDKLAALLWGDSTDERARQSLRQALLTLKQALPYQVAEIVHIESDTVALNAAAVQVDVAAFERLLIHGTPEALGEASTLYRGELLEGLSVQEAPFEDWLMTQRERLRELAVEGLARLLAHEIAQGTTERAVHTAARLLSLDPLQESVHRALMQLHARQGRRGVALRQYQQCVGIMQRELGAEPEEKTRALYQEILGNLPRTIVAPIAPPSGAAAPSELVGSHLAADMPLIGREAERVALGNAWEDVRQRRGRTVALLGEAGIGKSRLVSDRIAAVIADGGRVLLGRAHDSEQILPFGPWVDAFRTGQITSELAPKREANEFWVAELARLFPELGAPTRDVTEAEDYGRLFEAMVHAIGHFATRQPLLLVLEDVHWADEMTLRLLAFVSRRVSDWPVLLLVTARSEHFIDMPILERTFAELGRNTRFLSLSLSPLSEPDTVTLVGTLSRAGTDAPTVQRLGEQIWRVSEGNPFMVVETMRARYDEQASTSPEELRTPIRVRDVIASRLARLSERARELVALVSVIGRDFDFALLDRAAGLGTHMAAAGVEELVGRRILHAVGERLEFTHDRIREVAYDQLIAPRQRLLHAAVAHAIEDLYANDLESHCVVLGRHCHRAGLWEKAFLYLHQAGLVAARHAAHRDAITCFEQALDVLRHLRDRHDLLEQAIDLRFALRNSCVAVGEIGQVTAHLRAAETAAETLGDRLRLGWVLTYQTSSHFLLGENDKAMESGRRAVAHAAALGEPKLQIAAHLFYGQTCHAVGLYQRGAILLRHNIESLESELADRGDKPAQQIYSRAALACCLADLGEFVEGLARSAEAVRLAETADRGYALAHACLALGLVHLRRGDSDSALAVLQRGLTRCRREDTPLLVAALRCLLGYGYALSGDSTKSLPLCEDAVGVLSPLGGDSLCASLLGEAHVLAGRVEEAAKWARHALDLTRNRAERGYAAWALRLLADTACQHAPAEAEVGYRDALALAEKLDMRPLRGHCHLGRGRLRNRTGDHDGARADLRAAVDLFRSMDMALWLPDAEAELARLS